MERAECKTTNGARDVQRRTRRERIYHRRSPDTIIGRASADRAGARPLRHVAKRVDAPGRVGARTRQGEHRPRGWDALPREPPQIVRSSTSGEAPLIVDGFRRVRRGTFTEGAIMERAECKTTNDASRRATPDAQTRPLSTGESETYLD